MGILRTLFALAVVFGHSFINLFVGGQNAVQLFYMISGFLISYILVEKKLYLNPYKFYINRYLRLYPIYIFIALLTLIFFYVSDKTFESTAFFDVYIQSPIEANFLLLITNLTLFFQDIVMFSKIEGGQLMFAADFKKTEVLLPRGLLVPQAWSLGVELAFYIAAPYILKNIKFMLTVLILSIFLRIYIIWIGLGIKDPWTYRFFPIELSIFIIGALSHQILSPAYKLFLGEKKFDRFSVWVTYLLIFATLTYSFLPTPKIVSFIQNVFPFISKDFYKYLPIGDLIKIAVFYPIFALALPLIFNFQEKRPWDKWIGELSYPVYICHMLVTYLVILTIDNIATKDGFGIFQACINVDKFLVGICSAICSVIFSIFIIKFIAQPIEVIRNKYRDNF